MGERTRFWGRSGTGAGPGRDWIQASAGKGMAAQQPANGKRAATQRAVRRDGRGRILGARRQIPAPARADRMQRRRKPAAIESDGGEQEARHTSSLRALIPISHTPGFRLLSLSRQPFRQNVSHHGKAFRV